MRPYNLKALLIGVFIAVLLVAAIVIVKSRGENAAGTPSPSVAAVEQPGDAGAVPGVSPWQLRCDPPTPTTAKFCEVFERLSAAKTGQRVVEFAIGFPGKSRDLAHGVIVMPLGIALNEDIQMKVDGRSLLTFRPAYCTSGGCAGIFDFDKKSLAILQAGRYLDLSLHSYTGQILTIRLVLTGLDKALQRL